MREGLESARGGADGAGGSAGAVEVSLVGADPSDPSVLLLRAPDGGVLRLPVDGRLRAAVRSAGPASAPLPAVSEPLRPRDIQARIRAGETASDVAADAGVPIEQVRRYEGPVLAERAHVASLARLAVVRGGPGRLTLEDAVRTRLLARGADPASAAWDAWRRDGGWAVQVAFRAAGRDRSAQWSFTPSSRVLEALDDEARWLTAPSDDPTGRRLAAVRVYDVETDDGGVEGLPALAVPSDDPTPRDTAAPDRRGDPSAPAGPLDEPADEPRADRAPALPEALSAARTGEPDHAPLMGSTADAPEPGQEPEPEDPADDLASRTLELLDALRDRRGRRVPLDLDPDGNPWDDDEEDDDLLNALLDLPPGSHAGSEELQEEVDRARARLRMVTPPGGLALGGGADDQDAADGSDAPAPGESAPSPGRAALGLVPAPPPTEPVATTPRPEAARPAAPPAAPLRPLSAAPPPAARPTAAGTSGEESPAPLSRRERRAAEEAEQPAGPSGAQGAEEAEHDGDDPSEQPAKRRRSVPSWDEIVFGAPRRD